MTQIRSTYPALDCLHMRKCKFLLICCELRDRWVGEEGDFGFKLLLVLFDAT